MSLQFTVYFYPENFMAYSYIEYSLLNIEIYAREIVFILIFISMFIRIINNRFYRIAVLGIIIIIILLLLL